MTTKTQVSLAAVISFLVLLISVLLPSAAVASIPYEILSPIPQGLNRPEDIAISPDNRLHAIDGNRILIYDHNDQPSTAIPLERPLAVAVTDSRIYVATAEDLSVRILDHQGQERGWLGKGAGEFKLPRNITVDPANGQIFVVDQLDHSIKIYNRDGELLTRLDDAPNLPQDLALSGDEIFVLDQPLVKDKYGQQKRGAGVQVYNRNGSPTRRFGSYGTGEGELVRPKAIAADAGGRLYITDGFHGVVLCFDRQGNYLQTIRDPENPMPAPMGIALDTRGYLLVPSAAASGTKVFRLDQVVGTATPVADQAIPPQTQPETAVSQVSQEYRLYLPKVEDNESATYANIISILNLANQSQTITIQAHDADGTEITSLDQELPANDVLRLRPAGGEGSITGLASFLGSMTIISKQPLQATNMYMNSSGAFSVFGAVTSREQLFFPQVIDNTMGWQTLISIQNTQESQQFVTVKVSDYDGNTAGSQTVLLAPHALYELTPSSILDQEWKETFNYGADQIVGTVMVESHGPALAGMAACQHGSPPDSLSIYGAMDPVSELFIPLVNDRIGAWPEIAGPFNDLFLTSPTMQTATVELFDNQGRKSANAPVHLAFSQAGQTRQESPAELALTDGAVGDQFQGVLKISAPEPLYAFNRIRQVGTSQLTSANALAMAMGQTPATEHVFPDVFDGLLDWSSTLAIQNTIGVAHSIEIRCIRADGAIFTLEETVPANGVVLFVPGQSEASGLDGQDGYFQGAITLNSPQPVAAALQYGHRAEGGTDGEMDSLEIYNGLSTH